MLDLELDFNKLTKRVNGTSAIYSEGIVRKVIGLTIEVQGIKALLENYVLYIMKVKILSTVK